jgi:hypothetical protein
MTLFTRLLRGALLSVMVPLVLSAQVTGGYEARYEGSRWILGYGSYQGLEQFATNELQRMVQGYVPYVLTVLPAAQSDVQHSKGNLFLVGTAADNPVLADLGRRGLIELPSRPQSYSVGCLKSPFNPERRIVFIAGADPAGVLYGVEEFNLRLAAVTPDDPKQRRRALDEVGVFHASETPWIENRGLWTWGYVIYDYRRFIDHMARLKMNRLTVWNDEPPVNSRELIAYARARGVKIVFGFHWGWGLGNLDPTNSEHLRQVRESVLERYERDYSKLDLDGIYFQTFTEQSNTTIGGKTIAALACDWVNDIARALLARHPNLRIEFGLHATSILENYTDLRSLDPRVTIVWEDAGVIPYSYDPVVRFEKGRGPRGLGDVNSTIEYSKKLASFRPGSEFAMVAKGWTTLRWGSEFEHHGPFVIGEREAAFIRDRARERQPRWDAVNAGWFKYYPEALRFFREVRETTPTPMLVLGLIEDGLFEEHIQPSAAMLGEMLWNGRRSDQEMVERAMNPYYGSDL